MAKRRQRKSKVKLRFISVMALVSIIGFASILASTWFGFDFLSDNISAFILVFLGVGLMIEGRVRMWRTMAKGGLTSDELAHIVTGVVGFFSLVTGIIEFTSFVHPIFDAVKGIVALIAIIVIIIETWFVK